MANHKAIIHYQPKNGAILKIVHLLEDELEDHFGDYINSLRSAVWFVWSTLFEPHFFRSIFPI
jgi:hypothetical protein